MVIGKDIIFDKVEFGYEGQVAILQGQSHTFAGGKKHSIVGPSGVGKTTLIKLAMGLIGPDSGKVLFGDTQINNTHRIGYVAQNYALFPWLTVKKNIELGAYNSEIEKDEIERRVGNLCNKFGLTPSIDKFPNELSGGMKQRTAVARALCGSPELLCFDEPFSALDVGNRTEARKILSEISKDGSITVLFVTHDIHEAVHLSDYVHLLKTEGNYVELETIECHEEDYAKIEQYIFKNLTSNVE